MTELVIMLGPPRSFTSVVSAMVGQHPQLYGLPEVHLFTTETVGELFYFYKLAGFLDPCFLVNTLNFQRKGYIFKHRTLWQ